MNDYYLTCDVMGVHGTQTWLVEANSKEEAIEKWHSCDDAEFIYEEIEVTSLGKPEITFDSSLI